MAKAWYVLHVYSGYENKIERTIRMLLDNGELSKDIVTDIKVPSEDVVDVKDGKKRSSSRKILPGYILVEMDLPDDGWKATCSGDQESHRRHGLRRSDSASQTAAYHRGGSPRGYPEGRRNQGRAPCADATDFYARRTGEDHR